ncbi:hypothetical protein T459_34383 [Capsicum annuum]|uniref:Disease resistance RPP13-like protein 1 n=1 Tax=Capsicum annuum TaxID=4072 RepID=A0A2G2XWA4_CAPAN|nr:hypothetical protein T459_34383 [Capsicum annuum]
MFQKNKHDDGLLEKLEDILLGLKIVLSDAENKQASDQRMKKWLNKLQIAVDGSENLLEEVNYEASRLKVEGQHQNLAETSNLQEHFVSGTRETRTPSTSLVDESDVFGRKNEIEVLIETSKEASEKNLTVVPIVGMGGMGKATLAKAVYNDEKVKGHFGLKAWICVSETYDAFRISKGLLQEIGSLDSKDDNNLNQMQVKLKERLNGKRFLIVLDDEWNDNYNEWDELRNIFVQGGIGSKIIVTTRKASVALMMGSGEINVGTLSDEASWALFRRHSLENRDPPKEYLELEEVGKQIADKSKGLPLALKTLAGFLCSKSEVDERTDVLRSEIWELPCCPNDYQFCKEQVIHLWIANGLVQQLRSGNQYFKELRSRSLLERVPKSSERDGGKFLMHDLVNDLAQFASSKLCVRLEECQGPNMLEQSRHMSYSMGEGGDFEKLKPLSKSEQLRTLLPIQIEHLVRLTLSKRVLHNILPRLTSLRALSLSRYAIVELPDALFIKLKLLRFFDLSSEDARWKEQVIHLWIANGLVEQRGDERIQDLGNQYFNELRSRSLFERVPESFERDGGKFLMHDLVNDLAQIASSKLCVRLEECQGSHMLEQSWHMSYAMGKGGDLEKLNPLSKSERLRTLLPINIQDLYSPFISKRVLHNILPNLISLRALSLSHYWIKELPDALFIKLKLLRFLDLSWTEIIKLPDSICALFNLATLLLSSCRYLEELPLQMEKLVNLRHLDISNTFHLKMPLHLSKLKSLQVLVGAKFLLGGLRMEDLGQLHNLYGSLSILELQNVVDRREALKGKMREKEHVEKLSLKWSGSIADNSQTGRDILDELRPYSYIKGLQISGYRGTQFPNWLADPSFLKLLVQFNCKDCFSLPALGQLPCLKILSIREMHRITEVTEEFYGSLSSEKPFNSLERLEFAKMPEWKQWHVLGNGEFPALRNLSIENCPKLMGKLPENLYSLTELRFSRCPELNLETPIQLSSLKWFEVDDSPKVGVIFDEAELFTSQLELMKQIEKLYISDCNSLTSLPTSTLPSTLKHTTICRCQKLKLDLHECDSILSAELNIRCCENLEILSVACVTRMTTLIISECKKLKRLPEGMQELLPSLEELRLSDCPEIESFPDGGLPFTLQLLVIESCKKLVNGRKGVLDIYHDGSDEEIVGGENWELPCSIQSLTIDNLKTLSSQLLQSLTSLEYLDTRKLPQIQSLLEQGLPSSLSKLHLYLHNELHSLPTKGLRHLTSLQSLEISSCHQLQSLPESGLPSSLSELTIRDFPNLQSLPIKWIASSLSKLSICSCPLLKPLLEFDKGEYWPEIAHIPEIYIGVTVFDHESECL